MDYEGEDDNYEKVDKKTSQQRTEDKYAKETGEFSVTKNGLGEGIRTDRGIKDIFCLLLFIAFIVAMVFCTLEGNKKGQLEKLMAPLDGDDMYCGFPTKYKDGELMDKEVDHTGYPKLYLANL